MATKSNFFSEIFPNNSSSFINNKQFKNLNLNENYKYCVSNVDEVKSFSSKNEKIREKTEEYNGRSGFNNSTVKLREKLSWNSDEQQMLKKLKPEQPRIYGNTNSKSTLSLHIEAYEAAIEMYPEPNAGSVVNKAEQSKADFMKRLRTKYHLKHCFYEFPRQQNEPKITDPEVMQFKSSQKLANPQGPAAKKQKHDETLSDNPLSHFQALSPPSSSSENFTSKPSSIILQPSPSTPISSRPKYLAPSKPTVYNPMEWENYQDPDPQINQFVEDQKQKEKEAQEPPKPPKTREEILEEELKKCKEESNREIERLTAENVRMKGDLKTANHYISNKKYEERKAKRKLEAENEEENDENEEEKDFKELPKTTRYRIVNEIWENLQKLYSPKMAAQIINTIYNQKVEVEKNSLTPAETLQVLKDSGISISALRKIRSSLIKFNVPNPFASDAALNKERAKIHQSVKFKKETVMMSNTLNGPKVETNVYYRESVYDELKERMDGIINAGNYEPFYVDGEEVIAAVLTKDKATEYSKFCMGVGNTKAPINSPRGLSLLGYFKANDSQENIYAAYDREGGIGPQVDSIKELTVTIDGETKTLKVVWFVTGDFKFLNAIAGLNSNSCTFPCWNCEQKAETTYEKLDMDQKADKRQMKVDISKSQIREPLFKTIPFEQFIPPVLHITLGPGTQLFEALCERARQMDNDGLQKENVPDMLLNEKAKKSWEASQEKTEKFKEMLESLNHQKSLFENNEEEAAYACHSNNCVAVRDGINVNRIYEMDKFCFQCQSYFHKPCLYKGHCPHCVSRYPTPKQCRDVIEQDRKDIEKQIKQTSKLLNDEEEKMADTVSKFKLGSLAKNVEKAFQDHGGSRKVFFQSFTGKELTLMGENIKNIYFDLDEKLQNDQEILKIVRAIIKFFDMRKLLTTKVLEDHEIDVIEEKIHDFANYMKNNLPHFRVLHKGHSLFKHYVDFMRRFKIAAYFSDEAIESFHVIFNRYDRKINNRSPDKYAELMFKYNKEDTYIFDRFSYVDEE